MDDRIAAFEAAIRAQAGLISEAQELLTRYLASQIEARRLSIAYSSSSTGLSNARPNSSRVKLWGRISATMPDRRRDLIHHCAELMFRGSEIRAGESHTTVARKPDNLCSLAATALRRASACLERTSDVARLADLPCASGRLDQRWGDPAAAIALGNFTGVNLPVALAPPPGAHES
jgi:hypothetical protein